MIDMAAARRFCVYAAVGGLGTAAHYAVLLLLVGAGWLSPAPASVCGALVGALVNFVLNARITFRAAMEGRAARRFFLTAGVGALINGLAMSVLVDHAGLDFRLAQVIVTLGVLVLTYLVNSAWTFRANGAAAAPTASDLPESRR